MKKYSLISLTIFFALGFSVYGQATSDADVEKVDKMNRQVLEFYHQGQYEQALELAVQALKLSENTLGQENPETADCLNNLGGMYQSVGNYTNAAAMFERGLMIREKVLGPDHQYTARNLNNLGTVYLRMGKYTNAEPLLQRALAINMKTLGTNQIATITSLGTLGGLYQDMGNYTRAEAYAKQVAELTKQMFGLNHPTTATAMNNLASLYFSEGDYASAEPLLEQALDIYERTRGPEHIDTGRTLQSLATLYYQMGDVAKSEMFYQRALAVQEKYPEMQNPDIALALSGLAALYMDIGDYEKAAPLLEHALKVQEAVFGTQNPTVAKTMGKVATLALRMKKFVEADELDRDVLSIDEKILGPEHPETAVDLMNLGILYEHMGMLSMAEAFDEHALAIQEKVLGPDHPDVSLNLNNLATVYFKMGDANKASTTLLRVLDIDSKTLGPDHPITAVHLGNLATMDIDLQKTNEALRYADLAEQANLHLLGNILSFTSERQRLDYEARIDPYRIFATLNDAPRTALAILRHKGVVLDSLLEDRTVAEASRNPDDRALIEQLGPAKKRLMELLMQAPKNTRPDSLKIRSETRAMLSRQVEQLEGTLAQKVTGLGHARYALTVTVEQVQKAIPPQTVLVEFIQYGHYLGPDKTEKRYGAVIYGETTKPQWVGLGATADIEKNVLIYQQTIRNKELKTDAGLSVVLHQLYMQIWNPIEAFVPANTKKVILSPDGALDFVSFATLLNQRDQFLAEKYSLRYVASGRDLLREPIQTASQDMVLFANPSYASDAATTAKGSGMYLPPLPGTGLEANALEIEAKRWDWPIHTYLQADATEAQARQLHSPRILHFATHGFFLPDSIQGPDRFTFFSSSEDSITPRVWLKNPMYRSGIALAGAQVTLDAWQRGEVPPTETDGILTAEEVGGLDLKGTWLVVLSACDTGIGQQRYGEGVMGLRRGFVQAGAKNLLMTLWPVLDLPSAELMANFYSKLHDDNNPPEALAEVQREMLVRLRNQSGLWAAIVTAGPFIISTQGAVQ